MAARASEGPRGRGVQGGHCYLAVALTSSLPKTVSVAEKDLKPQLSADVLFS